MNSTKRINFSGRVQGVGFRYTTKQLALGFDIVGSVRNREDGTVELDVMGVVILGCGVMGITPIYDM